MPQICDELNLAKEKIAFISGIGCSSRFPHYMNTYGFHTIHGRAPTIATGLKLSRPDLQVWVVTGDGDGLSIGGNHLIHSLRRNVDIKVMLFDNRIYGLTKGQYSPTSEKGKKTKSSPRGSLEEPINPIALAAASQATFIARVMATDGAELRDVMLQAAHHRGSAFIQIFQNCNVFNDGAFDDFAGREVGKDNILQLKHGEPMIFGKKGDKAISLINTSNGQLLPIVVKLDDCHPKEILVHDANAPDSSLAYLLSQLCIPDFPVPMGIFRAISKPVYGDLLNDQISTAVEAEGAGIFFKHIRSGQTWDIQ